MEDKKAGDPTTYTIKGKRGIDDLQSIYAFSFNDDGGGAYSNEANTHINSQGWWHFSSNFEKRGVNPGDQEAIDKVSKEIAIENDKYISELHKEGKYGEEFETKLTLMFNPLYDTPSITRTNDGPLLSCKVTFLDFTKPKEDEEHRPNS